MFTMLLANAEGRAYLTDSKLLREIAMNLEALDPVDLISTLLTNRIRVMLSQASNSSQFKP